MAAYKFEKKDQITNEIIALLAEGKDLSEIAEELNLEKTTFISGKAKGRVKVREAVIHNL